MASDRFAESLSSQCLILQRTLLAEHRNALNSLRSNLLDDIGETGGSLSSNYRSVDLDSRDQTSVIDIPLPNGSPMFLEELNDQPNAGTKNSVHLDEPVFMQRSLSDNRSSERVSAGSISPVLDGRIRIASIGSDVVSLKSHTDLDEDSRQTSKSSIPRSSSKQVRKPDVSSMGFLDPNMRHRSNASLEAPDGCSKASSRTSRVTLVVGGADENSRRSLCSARSDVEGVETFAVSTTWITTIKRRTTIDAKQSWSWNFDHVDSEHSLKSEDSEPRGLIPRARRFLHWCHLWLMLEPFSSWVVCWESIGFILICYDIIVIPLAVYDPPDELFTQLMDWVIRIFWTFDIMMSLRTGFVDSEGVPVMSPYLVARRYATRQLWFDAVLVVIDWMQVIFQMRVLGIFKSRRVLRIVRIARLKRARDKIERMSEFINAEGERVIIFASLFKALLILLVSIHVLACMWWGAGVVGQEYAGEPAWIQGMDSLNVFEKYSRSFHCAIAFFYGEHLLMPRNQYERVYMVASLYFCFILQTWLVSSITNLMIHLEIASARRTSLFSALENFLRDNNVSRRLAMKVVRNARHTLKESERHIPEENIELLKFISEPLMIELHSEVYGPTVKVHPLFLCYGDVNISGVKKALHCGVSIVSLNNGDIVFTSGDDPVPRMLFIRDGEMKYLTDDSRPRTCNSKVWLCEAVLWVFEWIHMGTCSAQTDATLLALDALKFKDAVTSYPSGHLVHYAKEFVNMLNVKPEARTDVGEYCRDCRYLMETVFEELWSPHEAEYADLIDDDNESRRESSRYSFLGKSFIGMSTSMRPSASLRPSGSLRPSNSLRPSRSLHESSSSDRVVSPLDGVLADS